MLVTGREIFAWLTVIGLIIFRYCWFTLSMTGDEHLYPILSNAARPVFSHRLLEAVSECTISAVAPAPGAKLMIAGGGA